MIAINQVLIVHYNYGYRLRIYVTTEALCFNSAPSNWASKDHSVLSLSWTYAVNCVKGKDPFRLDYVPMKQL